MSDPRAAEFFAADVAPAVELARRWLREGGGPALAAAVLRELADESNWKRERALERLAALRDVSPLLTPLAEALGDQGDPERRNASRSALTALAAPDSADPDPVVHRLESLAESASDSDVRVLAIATLGEALQPRARPLLERLLVDPDPNVGAAAADSLGMLGDPRALPALVSLATDGPFWTRAAAVVALGRIRDPRAISALSLAAGEPWLSAAASQALGEIGDAAGLEALRRAVDLGGEPREAALRAAASILGRNPAEQAPRWLRDAASGMEETLEAELESSPEPGVARLLGLAGTPRAARALLDHLARDGDEETATLGLSLLPPSVATEAILGRLEAAEPGERTVLLAILPPLADAEAVRDAARWLADADSETRAAAAEALARSDRTTVLEVLPSLLANPDARVGAARVYGRFGPEACTPLIDLLDDREARVRATAAEGLGRCGALHLPRIMDALAREQDAGTRQALVSALGRIGGETAADALLPWASSEDPALRFAVVRALGESGAGAALPALLDALLDARPEIHAAALFGLGELGDARAERPLSEHLRDPDRDLRRTAARALDRLARPAAFERLRESLEDPDREVRLIAVRALQRLHDRDAVRALERLADSDPDALVRRTAAGAVEGIRSDSGEVAG